MKIYLSAIFNMDRFILSPQEYKRIILISKLSIVLIIALLLFIAMDIWDGFYFPIPYLLLTISFCIIVLFLNKQGHFQFARILLTLLANGLVIFLAAVLPLELGLYIFSICINISVIIAFGFERIKLSLTICILSSFAMAFATSHPYNRLPKDSINKDFINTNLLFSFIISSGVSLSVMYMLMRGNYKTESILSLKEKALTLKNKELVTINNELDRFFYRASHDLRAPLSSILGLIQLMEQTQDAKELKSFIPMLKGRAKNLESFIQGVAEYSTNSNKAIEYQKVFIYNVIRENLENLRFFPRASEIKIIVEVPSELAIISEPVRLQVILSNLLSNAIKYHDFEKSSRFIKVTASMENDCAKISIEDNGMGIKNDDLVKIFSMFYRANKSVEGTGLGLYIVKEAIEKIGGKITVSSVYKEGTTFLVILPLMP